MSETNVTLRSLPQYRLLPPKSTDERNSLKEAIQQWGVHVPIICDEFGSILDGHETFAVCQELGIRRFPIEMKKGLTEEEKRDFILSLNVNRRHLSREQKRALIANELRWRKANISNSRLAAVLGVDPKTVGSVRGELVAAGEIPDLDEFQGRDEKVYPAKKNRSLTVSLTSVGEVRKASEKLSILGNDAPKGQFDMRSLAKKAQSKVYNDLREKDGPAPPEPYKLYHSAFQEALAKGLVQENSAQLIYCDPPWSKEWLPQWKELGQFASKVLQPKGLLMVYTGNPFLPEILQALGESLKYLWTISLVNAGCYGSQLLPANASAPNAWRPMAVFVKGALVEPGEKNRCFFTDVFHRKGVGCKKWHPWQQPLEEAMYYIHQVTLPGDLIVDCCLGGCTTGIAVAKVGHGRRFIGFDTDEGAIRIGRQRFAEEVSLSLQACA